MLRVVRVVTMARKITPVKPFLIGPLSDENRCRLAPKPSGGCGTRSPARDSSLGTTPDPDSNQP